FGGYFGDGGTYRGWGVAVETKNPKNVAGWATKGSAEGIWAAGGMASDGNGGFAITGNSHSAHGDHTNSDGEEILRITHLAGLAPNATGKTSFIRTSGTTRWPGHTGTSARAARSCGRCPGRPHRRPSSRPPNPGTCISWT